MNGSLTLLDASLCHGIPDGHRLVHFFARQTDVNLVRKRGSFWALLDALSQVSVVELFS